MSRIRYRGLGGLLLLAVTTSGCLTPDAGPNDNVRGTRVASGDFVAGPAPLRTPSPSRSDDTDGFEDGLTGGEIFQMYCASCHNRRPMSERSFANYRNVAAHMRTRANLTGKEYEKLVDWMRRVQDAPLPNPDTGPSPKRFNFSHPIPELRPAPRAADGANAGSNPIPNEAIPGQ